MYALACSLQPRDQLENRESKDNKIFRRVWETVKTKVREVRMVETKRKGKYIRREREGDRERERKSEEKEENKEKQYNRY